jgi:hypothetical protein
MRTRLVLVLVALLLVAVPASAAERIRYDEIPEVNWPAYYKLRQSITYNGVPTWVSEAKLSFADDQFRGTARHMELDANGRPTLIMENVHVDGRAYWREQNATSWYVAPEMPFPPSFYLFDLDYPLKDIEHPAVLVSRVGDVTIRGVLATQYQFEMPRHHLPGYLSSAKFDVFLTKAEAAPFKWQWSMVDLRGDEPVLREWVVDAYDHGVPNTIVAPPADQVLELRSNASARRGGGFDLFLRWLRSPR